MASWIPPSENALEKFEESVHPEFRALSEEIALNLVEILYAVVAARRIEDPVADIGKIEKSAELL